MKSTADKSRFQKSSTCAELRSEDKISDVKAVGLFEPFLGEPRGSGRSTRGSPVTQGLPGASQQAKKESKNPISDLWPPVCITVLHLCSGTSKKLWTRRSAVVRHTDQVIRKHALETPSTFADACCDKAAIAGVVFTFSFKLLNVVIPVRRSLRP
jgi:hypothetical protein